MLILILLALVNGAFIGTSRALNGRLAMSIGAFGASFWNHLVGFIGLSLVLFINGVPLVLPTGVPAYAYLGGALGALYVAVNSHVLPRLGTLTAMVLVISGQMMAGLAIDWLKSGPDAPSPAAMAGQASGMALIVAGIVLGQRSKTPKTTPVSS